MHPAPELEGFSGERESALRSLSRFHTFDVMYYRTDLWLHSHRVMWIVEDILPYIRKKIRKIDGNKTRMLALVHDDPELITGDIPSWKKFRMSSRQKADWDKKEIGAEKKLARRFPAALGGYSYPKLLREIREKKTIESQVASYADKLDGHCESLHEAFAGNVAYLSTIFYYADRFGARDKEFPFFREIGLPSGSPFLDLKIDLTITMLRQHKNFGRPFTSKTVLMPTAFPWYDRWRALTMEQLGRKDGLAVLAKQKEGAGII